MQSKKEVLRNNNNCLPLNQGSKVLSDNLVFFLLDNLSLHLNSNHIEQVSKTTLNKIIL